MEWLRAIVSGIKVGEDGKIDVDATMKLISKEFPKHAVTKTEFDTKVGELKTATTKITELEGKQTSAEELQTKIDALTKEKEILTAEKDNLSKTFALKDALRAANCIDPDYLIFKHGGLEKFEFEEGDKPKIDEVTKQYKASAAHLFGTGKESTGYKPESGGGNPQISRGANMAKQMNLQTEAPKNDLWASK